MQKKLLQINPVSNYGSTGRITEDLGYNAQSNGWISYVAFGRKVRPSGSIQIRIGNRIEIINHVIQTRLLDNHGLASINATRRFIKSIEEIDPQIIHIHNLHGYYINYELLFKFIRSSGIQTVWTLHDCWPFTGHCVYFAFVGCDKWTRGCYQCPQLNTYPSSWLTDRSTDNFKTKKDSFSNIKNLTLVAVSKWIARLLEQSFLKNTNTLVINNGIDTTVFSRRLPKSLNHIPSDKDKFVILGIANDWTERKGLADFIKLSKQIERDYMIILVGLKNKNLHLLPPNIIGIHRTENLDELVDFYNYADVFVNPTWEDNFPTTNIEALACGTPVITYNTGGSPEAVDSETGFVIKQGDIQGLIEAISNVKLKGKSYFSSACRERALKHYNKDDRYNDYLHLYESLLKK
jgi:glycosyltransferase involved in cell wall biosynthesis